MLDNDSPVGGHETLLRVVPAQPHLYNFNTHAPLPSSFIPSKNDPDGLSMYRHRDPVESPGFLDAAELKAQQGNAATKNYGGVARVAVSDVTSLTRVGSSRALRVEASYDPAADLPGHVLLPDLSRGEYETNKDAVRELALRLSQRCSMEINATPAPTDR